MSQTHLQSHANIAASLKSGLTLTEPRTATGSTRQLMYRLLDQVSSQTDLGHQLSYTNSLRTSLTNLKAECKDKFTVINKECPKLWEQRKIMRQRVLQYMRKSIDVKAQQEEQEKEAMRQTISTKTLKLGQRIT